MNTYDYTYKGVKKKLTLSVNKDLVVVAKQNGINLSFFLEEKLRELINQKMECSAGDLNPGRGLERPACLAELHQRSKSFLLSPYRACG